MNSKHERELIKTLVKNGVYKITVPANAEIESGVKYVFVYDKCLNETACPCPIEKIDPFIKEILGALGGKWSISIKNDDEKDCDVRIWRLIDDSSTQLTFAR